jgi:glycosyltransferase involved in cell wall biosynthesis
MKVLLSAFSCHPFLGAEPSNGWNWAYGLARAGHNVWVLTTTFGKSNIERLLVSAPMPSLKVVYVEQPDLPRWLGRFRGLIQCLIWQRRALVVARRLDVGVDFDVVHHVTWGSLHAGSKLWKLGKLFVFGPVGGGQVAPPGFGRYFRGGRVMEHVRSIVVRYFTGVLFAARSTVSHSDVVLVTNEETRQWAERLGARRVEFMLDSATAKSEIAKVPGRRGSEILRLLWVGRLLSRKGVLLALEALAQVDRKVGLTCTIIGDGPQGRYLPGWIKQLELSDRAVWMGQVAWSEALAAYNEHDVFLFTSLRDSVGSQLIEAMARGNAIITLDHHGAHAAVPPTVGIKVPVTSPNETVAQLARAIERLAAEPETIAAMRQKALEVAREHTWERRIARASELYRLPRQGTDAWTWGRSSARTARTASRDAPKYSFTAS